MIELFFYPLNEYIVLHYLGAADIGGKFKKNYFKQV